MLRSIDKMTRAARFAVMLAGCAALGASTSCSNADVELPPPPPRGGPEPILPSASASASATSPSWVTQLPAAANYPSDRLHKGDRVWVALPVGPSEMVDVAIHTVDGTHDGLVSLTSRTAQRVDGVHPALVHPAPSLARVVSGATVLFYTPSTPAFLGRVADVVGGESIKIRYDQAGTTKTTDADHVQEPVVGIEPLAYVGFPKAGATSRGLVVAVSPDQVWIRTASGHVEVHDRGRVEGLPLPPTALRVGDQVRAYRWATGYETGAVTEVLEDGLRFKVRRDPRREGTYFFSSLLSAK